MNYGWYGKPYRVLGYGKYPYGKFVKPPIYPSYGKYPVYAKYPPYGKYPSYGKYPLYGKYPYWGI